MHSIASGNTVYTHPVAKVMISIPDQLLERLDTRARANRETRSGLLQRLVEREIEAGEGEWGEQVRKLLDLATAPMGGEGTRLIREDRDSR